MGRLDLFQIKFDHPQAVHFPGQWVRGIVFVTLGEPMKMRGINVNLVGRAKVHWHTYHNKNRRDYRSEEIYFDEVIQLHSAGGEDTTTLGAGAYEYPFEFLLLPDLPSSFEGEYGYVRYTAQATVDRPWKFDHVTKEAFTVLAFLDLNHEPLLFREPHELSDEKTVSCCCCISGSIDATITINKRAFVPGETLFISGVINNNSNTTVNRARAIVKQYIQFTAAQTGLFSAGTPHTKNVTSYEVKVEGELIQPGQVDVWTNVPLLIPALPASRLDGCGIIDITYVFKFYVDVDYTKFDMKTDIVIGTVPLTMFVPPQPLVITSQPTATPGDEEIGTPAIYNSLPPTYEECVMGKVKIREEKDSDYMRGNLTWAPMYPTFPFPSSAPGEVLPMIIDDSAPPNRPLLPVGPNC